ncbi:MAG TPA: site-2 protease family protein [Sphingomicrobium sp.]|nr:site-2 protease family protein [Sphingomicrobium sp.]
MADNLAWTIATWVIPLVIAIVFHEVSHGLAASWLGDPTARQRGRLSFNPIHHVDPVGTLILPMVLAVSGAPIFGWAKPVPVMARRLRNPRLHMVMVALAGPGMNLLLALFAAILLAVLTATGVRGIGWAFVGQNLLNFLAINIFLALFNLIPLPPFDGGHVVEGILPRSVARYYSKLRRFGLLILVILLLVLPAIDPKLDLVGQLIGPPAGWLTRSMIPSALQ